MKYTISGEIAQIAQLEFEKGESVWVSKSSLMSYSSGIDWTVKVPGGVGGAVRRSLAGEGLGLVYLESRQSDQYALVSTNAPGHIHVWDLDDGAVVTTRGSFLAAWGENIEITVTVARRAGAALFGGAGLFLQRVSGQGKVLIQGSGDFYRRTLAPGESIFVSTGNVAAFADQVDYDIQGVSGCRRALFGGEGLFVTRLTGPGVVLLQTLKRGWSRPAAASTG